MKSRRLIGLSLGLNLVLLATVCFFSLRRPAPKPVPREVRMTPQHATPPAMVTEDASAPLPDAGVESFTWAQLASTDFKAYRDRLRAIACPEETVRDIIVAEINEKFRLARAEIVTGVQRQYWEISAKGKEAFATWEESFDKLEEERGSLIEEVLGDEKEEGPSRIERQRPSWESRYAWLPPEKQAQLVEWEIQIEERNQQIWEEISKRSNTEATAADRQKLTALQEELAAGRQRFLSPDDYAEYRLRESPAGAWARNLAGFEASETEWRAVARLRLEHQEALQKAFPENPNLDEAFARRYGLHDGSVNPGAPGRGELRRQLQAELDAATKAALGPERALEYELASDSDYQQTRRITERHQLPERLAREAYEMQRTAAQLAEATRTDANLSAETRASALAAIRQETERALATTLGAKVFSTYQEYHGNWLGELEQMREDEP